MQYSRIKLLNRSMIIDKNEGALLNTFLKTKQLPDLEPFNAKVSIKTVVYGAVLHNDDCGAIDHKKLKGKLFAYPQADCYNQLIITDINVLSTMVGGGLTFTPFAALIESDTVLNISEEGGISAFLRIDDMDIITNMLNRECIYAIRELVPVSSIVNWRKSIDDTKMIEVAVSIK